MGQSKIDGLHQASIEPIRVLEAVYARAMTRFQRVARLAGESVCLNGSFDDCFRVGRRES